MFLKNNNAKFEVNLNLLRNIESCSENHYSYSNVSLEEKYFGKN